MIVMLISLAVWLGMVVIGLTVYWTWHNKDKLKNPFHIVLPTPILAPTPTLAPAVITKQISDLFEPLPKDPFRLFQLNNNSIKNVKENIKRSEMILDSLRIEQSKIAEGFCNQFGWGWFSIDGDEYRVVVDRASGNYELSKR